MSCDEWAMQIEDACLAELQQALAERHITAEALVRAYLARIEAYDRAGPHLNSVREINPDALAEAASCDRAGPRPDRPLAGIPILVKDNIATGDRMHTTAGSMALAEARAVRDATLVARLRAAGAVILGKANLTEFANILAIDMPAGYSSLGGQVRNPYAPDAINERGRTAGLAGRVEFGVGGRRRGRAVRGGDRHRDLGVAVIAGGAERACHCKADRRADQPRRHPADRAQPGHRRAVDPHRARCGDPAERARRPRPARPGDIGAAAAGRLHAMSRPGRAARRADRRAERPLRSRQRRLFR